MKNQLFVLIIGILLGAGATAYFTVAKPRADIALGQLPAPYYNILYISKPVDVGELRAALARVPHAGVHSALTS